MGSLIQGKVLKNALMNFLHYIYGKTVHIASKVD